MYISKKLPLVSTVVILLACISYAKEYTLVDVNVNFLRSIGGESVFDREKYINMHSTFNDNGAIRDEDIGYLHAEARINFGRETGGIYWAVNSVNEDAHRPGHADLNHLRVLGSEHRSAYNHARDPYKTNEVILSTIERPFYPNGTLTSQGWAFANKHATAEYIAHYIKEYYGSDAEPEPKFYEIINEPDYYLGYVPVQDIIDYHLVVNDSVRKYNPDIMIGGFSAANVRFEDGNFDVWNSYWKPFIDQVGDQMDFFSFHTYDFPHHDNQIFKKGSNIEAVFDMLEQYCMLSYGYVKPFINSEYGACCPSGTDDYSMAEKDWNIMKSYSSMLMSMLDRPHIMLKAIPFVMANTASWAGEGYPHDIYYNGVPGDMYSDHLKYYQLWRDVDGIRVHSETADPDIQADAYVFTDRIFLILTNLNTAETDVILNLHMQDDYILEDVLIKHLHSQNGVAQLDETILSTIPEYITIGAEGTAILRYNYRDTIPLNRYYTETKYYSTSYLQPIVQNNEAQFNIEGVLLKSTKGEATLRIAIGRDHGYSLKPQLTFNGISIGVPTDYMGYDQHNRTRFFGVIEVPIPFELIERNNDIGITFTDGTNGHIGSVTLIVAGLSHNLIHTSLPVDWIRPDRLNNETSNSPFSLYPNPASGSLSINCTNNPSHAVIRSLNGIRLVEVPLHIGHNLLDIGGIPKGIYIISIRTTGAIYSEKLVIR